MEGRRLELARFKTNKETKVEEIIEFSILLDEVSCLYRFEKNYFVGMKNGSVHKVPRETFKYVENILR